MADLAVGELPRATSIDDESLLVMEQQGEAKSVAGTAIKNYVAPYATAAQEAYEGVQDAINNIPEGVSTPIVNDLTTGGASMALSAEMGKRLNDGKLNKAGDTMAGVYRIKDGSVSGAGGRMFSAQGLKFVYQDDIGVDTSARNTFAIAPYSDGIASALLFMRTETGGTTKYYNILHTGNKPSGSYTGNGADRTIDVGGMGSVLVVYGNGNCFVVTGSGAFGKNSNGEFIAFAFEDCHFDEGDFFLSTATSNTINYNGYGYQYQVL